MPNTKFYYVIFIYKLDKNHVVTEYYKNLSSDISIIKDDFKKTIDNFYKTGDDKLNIILFTTNNEYYVQINPSKFVVEFENSINIKLFKHTVEILGMNDDLMNNIVKTNSTINFIIDKIWELADLNKFELLSRIRKDSIKFGSILSFKSKLFKKAMQIYIMRYYNLQ